MVKGYTDTQLLNRARKTEGFKGFPKGYWLYFIRSKDNLPNVFDDKVYLFKGEKFIMVTTCTTNSGTYGLLNFKKWNSDGTFIVKSDLWQYDIWKNGLHRGKMKALRQAKEIVGYRDNDGDISAEELGMIIKGMFYIHFHTVSYNKIKNFIRKYIGGWSVGCMVVNNVEKYYKIMSYLYSQKRITFLLVNEF